jgi:hypothetical protein
MITKLPIIYATWKKHQYMEENTGTHKELNKW